MKDVSIFAIGFFGSIDSEYDPAKLFLLSVRSEYERGKMDSFSYSLGVTKLCFLLPSSFTALCKLELVLLSNRSLEWFVPSYIWGPYVGRLSIIDIEFCQMT